ncbi:MAG: hypothetical protein QOH61_760 [Chloroflexota bacterium]|nr:hypothetical protein [Chloroflexota bacterium]
MVIVAVLAMLTAGIHQTATIRVAAVVDSHWRGAYDILVRPGGARLDLEQTNGLVEPNFVGFAGGGGISLDGLAAIRSVDGVDLAAPVGFIGYIRDVAASVVIEVDRLPEKPTLYRVSLTTTTTDGLASQLVQREVGEIVLGPAVGSDPTVNWTTDLGDVSANQDADGTWIIDVVTKRGLPGLAIPILAVDPVAEKQLLPDAPDFLDPLAAIGTSRRTAGTFDTDSVDPDWRTAFGQLRSIQSPGWQFGSDRELPVIPLIVSDRQAAALRTDLSVDQEGHSLDDYPTGGLDVVREATGAEAAFVGAASVDTGATLAPLRNPSQCVLWPNSTRTCAVNSFFASSSLDGRLVVRPTYAARAASGPDSSAPAYTISRVGIVAPDGDPTVPDFRPADTAATGAFAAYRQLKSVPLAVSRTPFSPHANIREPFVLAPVGTFDATTVKVPADPVDYVPLGAYDPSDTTLIADAAGSPTVAQAMTYPLLPNGLVTTPPLAITDLAGAVTLRGDSPIDAVRVRVAGVTDFGEVSKSKIESVATGITRLGFDVDIVAGSSPQAVDLYVPGYHVEQTPAADLGWVRQHWTTIGAADRVTQGFDSSDLALLSMSIGAAAVWAVALAGLRLERRTREAAILATIGWSRRELTRWFTGEALVGALAIGALGLVGYLLAAGSPEALIAAIGMGVLWFLAGLVAAVVTIRHGSRSILAGTVVRGRLRSAVPVRGPLSYAARAAVARASWVTAIAFGLGAASAAIAVGASIVAGLSARIGPTLLASAAGAAAAAYQPLMLVAMGTGSLAFVVAALRLDRRRRAPEALVLSISGWSPAEIHRMFRTGLMLIAAIAAVIGSVLAWGLAVPFGIELAWEPTLLAAMLALSAVVWGAFVTRGVVARPGDLS